MLLNQNIFCMLSHILSQYVNMIKRQNPKVILTIVMVSILSILFVLHKNHDVISFHIDSSERKDLEISEDPKYFLDYEDSSDHVILNEENCENDFNKASGEGWTGRINQRTNYLKHRSYCILKFCGEVCDTKHDFETGRYLIFALN